MGWLTERSCRHAVRASIHLGARAPWPHLRAAQRHVSQTESALVRPLNEALSAVSEESDLDFKVEFDPKNPHDFAELTKDLVAMANSQGGTVLIGITDSGDAAPPGKPLPVDLDPAEVADKISAATGCNPPELRVIPCRHPAGFDVLAIEVDPVSVPLVFERDGNYTQNNQTRSAYRKGSLYFRHGAKSEPASNDDIRAVCKRAEAAGRAELKADLRLVMEADPGSKVTVVAPGGTATPPPDSSPSSSAIRLVDDPAAPVIQHLSPDQTHPYRQKELVAELCRATSQRVTGHDIQVLRRLYAIDSDPNFSHKSKYGTRQYSTAFCDWIAGKCGADPEFLSKSRDQDKAQRPAG